jgi:CRISPR/Cas system CSM-associated protein Csm2 small subunit
MAKANAETKAEALRERMKPFLKQPPEKTRQNCKTEYEQICHEIEDIMDEVPEDDMLRKDYDRFTLLP